jgi:hypothetical protein
MAISRQVVLVVPVCLLKAIRCRVRVACQEALADMVVIRVLREATVALRVPVVILLLTCPTLAMEDIKARVSTWRTLRCFTNWTLKPQAFSWRLRTYFRRLLRCRRIVDAHHTSTNIPKDVFPFFIGDGFEMVFMFCMHVLNTNLVPSAKSLLSSFSFQSPIPITSPMYPYRSRDCTLY